MKHLLILPALMLVLTGCTGAEAPTPQVPELPPVVETPTAPAAAPTELDVAESLPETPAADASNDDVLGEVDALINDLDNL